MSDLYIIENNTTIIINWT